jgi:hypothetical protein
MLKHLVKTTCPALNSKCRQVVSIVLATQIHGKMEDGWETMSSQFFPVPSTTTTT